jgi:hypothetical protein
MKVLSWKSSFTLITVIFGVLSAGDQLALAQGYSFTSFDYPGTMFTSPAGINNSGDIVGTANDLPETSGFLYVRGSF